MEGYERIPEVEAFMERFNYFRKPYNKRDGWDRAWTRVRGLAGDQIVKDALDGKGDIGLLMSRMTSFICFDIDTPGKPEEESCESERIVERQESSEELEGEAERERQSKEDALRIWGDRDTWPGWADVIDADAMERFQEDMDAVRLPVVEVAAGRGPRVTGPMELTQGMRDAVRVLVECFNEEPSLVARSPHGVHVLWCLEEKEPWYRVKARLLRVKREWIATSRERGIGNTIEVLPTPTQPLRIPRKDRILESRGLERLVVPADGEAFWRSLRRYPIEGLIKGEVLDGTREHVREPGPRLPKEVTGVGGGVGTVGDGDDEADLMRMHPRNRSEAEALCMPFSEGMTNGQLIKLVEGGKREGMTLDDVTEWILGWETRSRESGYRGDIFRDHDWLRERIRLLYEASTATAAGATRFIELWERKKGEYARNEAIAGRMLEALERVQPLAKQSRRAVLRFFGDIEAWRRIVDDAAADPASGLDETSRRNQGRGAYPLPHRLLRRMHWHYETYWSNVQVAGILNKDDHRGGKYVPIIGRPQYFQIYIDIK